VHSLFANEIENAVSLSTNNQHYSNPYTVTNNDGERSRNTQVMRYPVSQTFRYGGSFKLGVEGKIIHLPFLIAYKRHNNPQMKANLSFLQSKIEKTTDLSGLLVKTRNTMHHD
jgi:hypothetical protein